MRGKGSAPGLWVRSTRVLPHTRWEHRDLRREIGVLPGAQPRSARDRDAEAALTPGSAAWGAPGPAALGDYRLRVLFPPNVVAKHAHEALPHEIKPLRACAMKDDLDGISLPGFLLFPSTRCKRDPLEFLFGEREDFARLLPPWLPARLRPALRRCGGAEQAGPGCGYRRGAGGGSRRDRPPPGGLRLGLGSVVSAPEWQLSPHKLRGRRQILNFFCSFG